MTKRKTMTDIARECGVSQSTVSLVLSNNPRIGEATRAKILQAIERSGYRPNIHARGLVMDSSRIISVVLPAFEHVFAEAYFGELLSGIYAGASEAGYKVLLDLANLKFVRTQEYLNLLESRRVDGMIFLGSTEYDRYLSVFDHSPHKFLLINDYFPNLHIGHVMSDHRARGAAARGSPARPGPPLHRHHQRHQHPHGHRFFSTNWKNIWRRRASRPSTVPGRMAAIASKWDWKPRASC
jgi:DNA-binding LacI/PurR family transcriptional regulator